MSGGGAASRSGRAGAARAGAAAPEGRRARGKRIRRARLRVKRCFDVAVSLAGILLLLPLWAAIALLVRATSPGPAFFVQERPGYRGRLFKVYKFRTMRPGSERMEKGVEVTRGDGRVTPLGRILRRTKLDEAPQLLNVLKGEMSLVGPRPERVASLADYTPSVRRRLDMLPGMTGLAQVSGNIYLDLGERYRLDVYYVDHFSITLDVRILIRTVGVVLFGEERYRDRPLAGRGKAGGGRAGGRLERGREELAGRRGRHAGRARNADGWRERGGNT